MKPVVYACHGILNGRTDPNWPNYLNQFLDGVKVVKKEYLAFPLPLVNVFVKNRWLARGLANDARLMHQGGYSLNFVGHSNGTHINLLAIRRLAKLRIPVNAMIAIGGVIEPDIEKSGVYHLLRSGMLRKAVCYCSNSDGPLSIHLKWPYKDAGKVGWQFGGIPVDYMAIEGAELITRRFDGWGHSEYFTAANRDQIFRQVGQDLGVLPES